MKEKIFKKLILGVVLVLSVILLSTNSYANITNTTNTGNITITGLENGVGVNLYQLITVHYDYNINQPLDPTYTWVETVNTWLASTIGSDSDYSDYANNPEAFYNDIENNSESASEFYNSLATAVKSGDVDLTVTDSAIAESTGEVTFENCEMGTYLILVDNGYNVYQPTVVNLVPKFSGTEWILENATVAIKSKSVSITKTAGTSINEKDNYSTADTINFTILADVPTYLNGSVSKAYYISDIVSEGLTYNETSLKVYGITGSGTSTELDEDDAYIIGTVRTGTLGNATFVLNFDYSKISSYAKIKVEYTTKLNSDTTVKITDGNINTAYLDYSNNAYTNTIATQESTFTVYTYGIEVTKVDKTTQSTTLSGAEFNLLDLSNNTLSFIWDNGVYYLANSTDIGATTKLKVDDNGKLCIYGLDEGTYELKETKAPDGYNLSQTIVEIKLTDAEPDGILDGDTDGIHAIIFTNSAGFVLPLTGGMGTVVFTVIGIVLFGLGVILLVGIIKNEKEIS